MVRLVFRASSKPIEDFETRMRQLYSIFRGDKKQVFQGPNYQLYIQSDSRVGDCRIEESNDFLHIQVGPLFSERIEATKLEASLSLDPEDIRKSIDDEECLLTLSKSDFQLNIVSDAWGYKPLYYYDNHDDFILSSDMKGILSIVSNVRKKLNHEAILEYVAGHMVFGHKTLFQDLNLVPDGSFTSVSIGDHSNLDFQRWNEWPHTHTDVPFETHVEECGVLLQDAVQHRIRDGSLLFLSGGLDSRTVLANIPLNERSRMTAVNFGVEGYPDTEFARLAAERHGMPFEFIPVNTDILINQSFQHMWMCEGVSSHTVAFLVDVLSRFQSAYVIEGFAGDTQFGGNFHNYTEDLDAGSWPIPFEDYLLELLQKKGYIRMPDLIALIMKDFTEEDVTSLMKSDIKQDAKAYAQSIAPTLVAELFLLRNRIRRYTLGGSLTIDAFSHDIKPFYNLDFINRVMQVPAYLRRNHKLFFEVLKKYTPSALEDETTSERTTTLQRFYLKYIKPTPLRSVVKKFTQALAGRAKIELSKRQTWLSTDRLWRSDATYRKWALQLLRDNRTLERGIFDAKGIEEIIHRTTIKGENVSTILTNAIDLEITLRLFSDGDGFNMFISNL